MHTQIIAQRCCDGPFAWTHAARRRVAAVQRKPRGGKDKKFKFTNIVEELDLPVPRPVAYQAWTQFEEFPSFMKKVENVEQEEDTTVEWKAQIFWSHRSWTAEILDQVQNERIVWRSKGDKGDVDGAVTFHEFTPEQSSDSKDQGSQPQRSESSPALRVQGCPQTANFLQNK